MRNDIEIREAQLEYYGIDFDESPILKVRHSNDSFRTPNNKQNHSFGMSDFSDPVFDEKPFKTNARDSTSSSVDK